MILGWFFIFPSIKVIGSLQLDQSLPQYQCHEQRGILRVETALVKNVIKAFAIFSSLIMLSSFATNVIFRE